MNWRRYMVEAALTGLMLMTAAQAGDAPTPRMTVKGYQVRQLDDKGNLAWTLHGEKAVIAGRRVDFTKLDGTIAQPDGKPYVVSTPSGTLNRETRIVSSTQPIKMTRESMTVEGVGYDLDMTDKTLVLRSKVKITIANPSLKTLGKTLDKE